MRAAAFLLLLLAAACKTSPESGTALKDGPLVQTEPVDLTLAEFGFDPAARPMSEAARRGLSNVFGGHGFRMLVPERLFTKIVDFDRNRQWRVYGNPPSPASRRLLAGARGLTGDGKDVGLGFAVHEQGGKRYVNFTCFECHAGVVAGTTVAGLANAHGDQLALSRNLVEFARIRAFYRNELSGLGQSLVQALAGLGDDDVEHLMQFSLYSQTILEPMLKLASTRGDNLGVFPVWMLLARLKAPGSAGFDLEPIEAQGAALAERERLVTGTPLGPVDTRPWWVRKHDVKSYVYGDTLTEPRAGKDFAINFTVPHVGHNESYGERSRLTADILAFALESESPPYPYDGDDARADDATIEAGRKIYNRDCARCHGRVDAGAQKRWRLVYKSQPYAGEHDEWRNTCLPDVLYSTAKDAQGDPVDPAWTKDTDLVYSCALIRFNALARYAAGLRPFFAQERFGLDADWLPAVYNPQVPGYRAPPLVGVWASAPYLHNGSIPTLGDLFLHEELTDGSGAKPRPLGWSRVHEVSKDLSYDARMVGMQVEPYYAKADFPQDPGLDYDLQRQVEFRRFYDTTAVGKSAAGAESCGSRLDQAGAKEKDKVLAFLKELTDANVEPDGGACPHPPKPPVLPSQPAGGGLGVKDHPLCKTFYQGLGVATY